MLDAAIAAQLAWQAKPEVRGPISRAPYERQPKLQTRALTVIYNQSMPEWLEFARAKKRSIPVLAAHMEILTGHLPRLSTVQDWIKKHEVETVYLGVSTGLSKLAPQMLKLRHSGASVQDIIAWCATHGFDVDGRQVSSALGHEQRRRREGKA